MAQSLCTNQNMTESWSRRLRTVFSGSSEPWSPAQNHSLFICHCRLNFIPQHLPFSNTWFYSWFLTVPHFEWSKILLDVLVLFPLTLWCIAIGTSRGWENVQRKTGRSACKGYCQAHKNVRRKPLIKHSSSESLDFSVIRSSEQWPDLDFTLNCSFGSY